jgi:Holliday junction resolvasome RuvABC endonuclease subunit
MKVLSFDSGAERMGWAAVGKENGKPYYHISGVLELKRGPTEPFQHYRMRLTQEVAASTVVLIDLLQPDEIASEIIPAVGFNNSTQSYLANVAITTVHVIAITRGLPIYQIGANTVKKEIAVGGKTKVRVRNGVIQLLPELAERKSSWVKIFDEPDAIAIGLTHLGFKNPS